MRYRFLGNTGLRVSELCFGCMTFGQGFFGIGEVEQEGATALVKRALMVRTTTVGTSVWSVDLVLTAAA